MSVVRVSSHAELLVAHDDAFIRWQVAPRGLHGWVGAGAAVWAGRRHGGSLGWLSGVGDPGAVAGLVAAAYPELPSPAYGLTVPRGAMALLPAHLRPARTDDWDWFLTSTPPVPQAGEHRVACLEDADAAIADLLAESSPRHDADPGDDTVRRWCGVRDGESGLVAVAAHTEHVPGVPHLASIATLPRCRGRGLGTAVTAWLTRQLLADGAPVVTLGMYADNAGARRMYGRLGYRNDHHFTSGRLPPAPPAIT